MRRLITPALYAALLEAYRLDPGNYASAARAAGVGRDFARRAWEAGWTDRYAWAKPIQWILETDGERARAEETKRLNDLTKSREETFSLERSLAKDDAVQALAQEGQLLKVGRVNVLAGLINAADMIPATKRIVSQLLKRIEDSKTIDFDDGLRVLRDFSTIVKNLVQTAQLLVEAERQSKGEPSKVIGLEVDGTITVEDAMREIEEVTSLYQLAKERGLLARDPMVRDALDATRGNGNGGAD